MRKITYDLSMLVGIILIGVGVGMWSVPASLVTVGSTVIVLTIVGVLIGGK